MGTNNSSVPRKKWTRDQRLTLIGLILATIGLLLSLTIPEIRRTVGLEASVDSTVTSVPATAYLAPTTADSAIRTHPVLQYFPLYVGTSWTYSYAEEAEGHGDDGRSITAETTAITETVAMVTTTISDKVYVAKIVVSGRPILVDCHETLTLASDAEYWMVADESRVFIACSKRQATALSADLVTDAGADYATSTPPKLPAFILPLEEGSVWQAFPDIPANEHDPAYQWHVQSKLDVRVPAGVFTDCYRIQLFTHPDTTKRWVCPGIGIVAAEYNHHGTTHNYRAELLSYEIAGEQ